VAVALRARGTRRDGGAGRQERGRDLTRRRFLEQGALAVFAAALVGLVTSAVDYVVTSTARTGRIYRLGSAEALRSHLRAGPAPRGLDRYEVRVEDAAVVVDTARKILGPPPGTDTTAQRPAGPHCN
jgi:hypothetical protein